MAITSIGSSGGGLALGNAPKEGLAKIGYSVTLSPTPFMLVRDFDKLGVNIKSFREPLMRSIRQVAIPSIDKNFEVEGRPHWAPLSDETWAIRDSFGNSDSSKILEVTGKLRKRATQLNIWTVTQDNAFIADLPDDVWYGRLHQGGYTDRGKVVPARPFVMFQEEDLDKIRDIFADWLGERVAAAGFV